MSAATLATDDELSPEAAVYLRDLRDLPFDDFRKKHSIDSNANAARARSERRSEQARGQRG